MCIHRALWYVIFMLYYSKFLLQIEPDWADLKRKGIHS
jgi:hypothetical protein